MANYSQEHLHSRMLLCDFSPISLWRDNWDFRTRAKALWHPSYLDNGRNQPLDQEGFSKSFCLSTPAKSSDAWRSRALVMAEASPCINRLYINRAKDSQGDSCREPSAYG
ncbi:Hypothetical predicted protein [Podarcis lilfordi]|uniref:Uncharacterized protein n=1 Tax=Podarcis lilfordi TaxID=74358 RepID=A0AA35JU64_9SAUR|nr:Hypothetical predicted protein [Podarcis lilfordi]